MSQPFLHDLVSCVQAPIAVLSSADGQIRPAGAEGLFCGDVRFLSELVVTVAGREPVGVGHRVDRAATAEFIGAVPGVGDPIADPTVRLERHRTATPSGLREELRLVNDSRSAIRVKLAVRAAADMAPIHDVKQGRRPAGLRPEATTWTSAGRTTELRADRPDANVTAAADHVVLTWVLDLPARDVALVTITVEVTKGPGDSSFDAPATPAGWDEQVQVHSVEPRLGPLVRQSLADLGALVMADSNAPDDVFAAAGSPWFFTLFGRDSLWAARFALPIDVELAAGTLRALSRRQGRAHDLHSGEEPGKILHEVRAVPDERDGEHHLPPVYFGTIDATPLWISLLHDAWCWGLPVDRVEPLLDPLRAALDWVVAHDEPGRSGFLAYHDVHARGLANQGWKDSGDSIQDAAGAVAPPPITLCEAQAYAHRAALDGARLLDAFERPGAERARAFAAGLADRFRETFWVDGEQGRYPAVAIDGWGRLVDSLTSNIGHLESSGLLDADESALVARWVTDDRLASGYGLRTLDATHPHFNPLGYHSGSVWPHDTAIVIGALRDADQAYAAATLTAGLLRAAESFDYRMPELFGGWAAVNGPVVAYPAACRPQAWSAAAVVALVRAALGLRADVPAGRLTVAPHPAFAPLYPLEVTGLQIAGHRLDVAVDADGHADVTTNAPVDVVTV